MSLSITDIILRLECLKTEQPEKLSLLRSHDRLVSALKELDSIVEMKSAKEAICLQLQYIIMKVLANVSTTNIFDDHMLHTVISGPPGIGKTHLGKILAQIWYSLGILKGRQRSELSHPEVPEIPESTYQNFISQYDTVIRTTNSQLNKAADDLDESIRKINGYVHYYNDAYTESILRSLQTHQSLLRQVTVQNTTPVIVPTNEENDDLSFRVATRADFVDKFVGHTAPKTYELLQSCIGGVLFIDEAYSLINSDNDSFGMEALTELNKFMSEHPNEIIVIFAGYKDLLDLTIFKAQPGLRRRCSWIFEIDSYTPIGLSYIFKRQLSLYNWSIHPQIDLVSFFTQNLDKFSNFGGDTHRLVFYCKLYHMHHRFVILTDEPVVGQKRKRQEIEDDKLITKRTLLAAFEKYQENKSDIKAIDEPPYGMYI